MTFPDRIALLLGGALVWGAMGTPVSNASAMTSDIHLHCEGETRSRLLAFTATDLKIEERQKATCQIRIEIQNGRRATIIDTPSDEVLFAPSQCHLSAMKVTCEARDDNHHRQIFVSRTSGDTVFEGYSQTSDERSALVVERYQCIKENRELIF